MLLQERRRALHARIVEALGTLTGEKVADQVERLAHHQGDLHRVLPLLERAIDICQEADLLAYFPPMAAALGAAYTLDGRVADAVPPLTRATE
jgi:hypothetical protein